jgi:DNA-binding transcriptional regulator LsrR (DeoR family)
MKKAILLPLLLLGALIIISWGRTGHYTIGRIAEKHLSTKAKTAIHDLIGDTSLADISTYADEIRSQEAYKYTGPFHYINLPLGLNPDAFPQAVLQ